MYVSVNAAQVANHKQFGRCTAFTQRSHCLNLVLELIKVTDVAGKDIVYWNVELSYKIYCHLQVLSLL